MNVGFYLSNDNMITLKSHFWCKNIIILSLCMQLRYGRHNDSQKSITNSGLWILFHGIISIQDTKSCYKRTCIYMRYIKYMLAFSLLVASGLLIAFVSSLDPDQKRQNVDPDLDPNCLTLIVFLKDFFF